MSDDAAEVKRKLEYPNGASREGATEPEWFIRKYVRRNYGALTDDRTPDVLEKIKIEGAYPGQGGDL